MELLTDVRTGKFYTPTELPSDTTGMMLLPVDEAEPYFEQNVRSTAWARERTEDGRFDQSHLSPENAWRIGRDYIAHSLRYGWPMHVIRRRFGPGARILEMGCGKEIPIIRTTTCDHSAMTYYKPALYVGADLNKIKYRPNINGIDITLLDRTNIVDEPDKVPDVAFDLVVSFEVVEHMDKDDGIKFLTSMYEFTKRKADREGKTGVCLLSTPVNGGTIAKNHIYEWGWSELRRNLEQIGFHVHKEWGTFANLKPLYRVLTPAEREVYDSLVEYLSPHVLSCMFAPNHPEAARNIAWELEVRP